MALFNKLFNKNAHTKHQDHVSEKFFAFNKDQVRMVLFRECDFRGRKLLFDSSSVKKILLNSTKTAEDEKISEISNGYGYIYTKPQPDFTQLAEMVFGSVAMSFRGTYFKMHTLEAPNRLMFTQVFSSPRPSSHGRISVSSRSDPHNLEHSKLDDSGASSMNSMSEHFSVHSTASDTVLVCRRHQSTPLDVPVTNGVSSSIPSLIGDSGYGADHSYATISSGPPSVSTWGSCTDNGASTMSLSCSSLYKKWLRRNSTSLHNSGQSIANLGSTQDRDSSRPHHRSSKLGLALILHLTSGQEEDLNQFFMEHISLLEAVLWRARQKVEAAYTKSQNFASLMMEMVAFSTQYLVNLLSGSYLSMNLWLSLSTGCDNYNSISAFSDNRNQTEFGSSVSLNSSCNSDYYSDFHLFNFTKFLKTDPFNIKRSLFGNEKNLTAERFVQDFCELLETVDVKDTNFFMSTLLTAVLTYHLGWVNTCLPSANEHQAKNPFNPLWGGLSDLYGAVGHPTKIAQTVITGINRKDLISKILVSMTYFIRCCDVDRRMPIRAEVEEENKAVEAICSKDSCIPKENYKKYEDHLKEIMNGSKDFFISCQNNNNNNNCKNIDFEKSLKDTNNKLVKKATGLAKTKTCFGNLSELVNDEDSVPACSSSVAENSIKSMETTDTTDNVVFVLGENEKLIGLKKDTKSTEPKKTNSSVKTRPSFLDLSKQLFQIKDSDFVENPDKNMIKPSTSWSSLSEDPKNTSKFARSQSEPPESPKPADSKNKSKYRYSGVKFNLQQHPQILSNYMKSKNLEISNLHFGDKGLKLDDLSSLSDTIISKYPEYEEDYEEGEALQTPSNASELEFTSDTFVLPPTAPHTRESNLPNSNGEDKKTEQKPKMKVTNLPMPKSKFFKPIANPIRYTSSLMRAASDSYIPDMVLQAPIVPKQDWESRLRSDLVLASQHSLIDQPVEEAVAIIANTDTWEVQLMSSHTFIIDKGSSGIRIGMSQLVANMLESLLQMWKLNVPPHYCLMHIEQALQELFLRSKALAELLLATEFCSMEQLTSALHLEVNDVPLLLAVASTHSPQVTQKYGLSFQ